MTATRPPGTVLQQPVFSVDGWAGNTVDAEGVEWWVTKEEGWASSPAVRLTMTDRPERDGAFDAPSYRSPRVITLEGTAIAPDRISKERAKDGFAAVLNDGSQLFPLVVTEPHAVRRAMVRLSGESKIMDKKAGAFEFSVQVTAPDPLRYSAELRVATCPLPSSAGGLSFPLAFPLDFGTGATGGRLSLENNGTVAAWPTWKISGPCADPVLINTQTGEELAFQIQLAAGEVLVVDTDARTVLLQGLASRRSVMLPHSRWFPLVRGGIDVAFRAGAYNPAARLTAEWRDAWS